MRRSSVLISLCIIVTTLTACSTKIERNDSDVLEVKKFNTVMQTEKDLIDPVHGKQTEVWYGAMTGVGETKANGISLVHRFADGASAITVNLNVLLAKKGYHYTAVLMTPDQSKSVDIGEVSSIIGDARHSAKAETMTDTTGMTLVHVYEVQGSKKPTQGTLIAVGTLKLAPSPK